jgi:heme A synthase
MLFSILIPFTVVVILWGSFVRLSGSGDGCGQSWPACNGQLVPDTHNPKTAVEYFHRLSSGLCLLLTAAGCIAVVRSPQLTTGTKTWAKICLGSMILETLLGASLVLLGLVAYNTSQARLLLMGFHLANTCILLGAMLLTRLSFHEHPTHKGFPNSQDSSQTLFKALGKGWVTLFCLMLLVMSGSWAALADTLFPARSLLIGLIQDFSPDSHIFIRLRIIHPILAITFAIWSAKTCFQINRTHKSKLFRVYLSLLGLQVLVGARTLTALHPLHLQLTHLTLALSLWLTLVAFFYQTRQTQQVKN